MRTETDKTEAPETSPKASSEDAELIVHSLNVVRSLIKMGPPQSLAERANFLISLSLVEVSLEVLNESLGGGGDPCGPLN